MPGELQERIRSTMDRHGWTQIVAAERLGVRQGDICKYLQGSEPRGRRYLELWNRLDSIDGDDGAPELIATVAEGDVPEIDHEPPRGIPGMFAWLRGER